MSDSQGAGTAKREVVLVGSTEAYATGLEAAVLQGLGQAIENAVQAQQQLYVTGQAAFTEAVAHRLSGGGDGAETPGTAPPASSPEALGDLHEGVHETVSAARSAAGGDPAEITRSLMSAFAESLDLLSAVHAQQMMGYVRVLVALGFDYQGKELGPAAAKAFEEVFEGDALVQTAQLIQLLNARS